MGASVGSNVGSGVGGAAFFSLSLLVKLIIVLGLKVSSVASVVGSMVLTVSIFVVAVSVESSDGAVVFAPVDDISELISVDVTPALGIVVVAAADGRELPSGVESTDVVKSTVGIVVFIIVSPTVTPVVGMAVLVLVVGIREVIRVKE